MFLSNSIQIKPKKELLYYENKEEELQEIEELVAWAKTNLPLSAKSLLWLNQALQELIEKILAAATENKSFVKQRIMLLNDVIGKLNPEKKYFKVKPLLYLLPYFRDTSEMCPPVNDEAISKSADGPNFDMLAEPPRKFPDKECQKLTDYIKRYYYDTSMAKIDERISNLKVKVDLSNNSLKTTRILCKKLKTSEKEASKLRSVLEESKEMDLNVVGTKIDVDWKQVSLQSLNGIRTPVECKLIWNNFLHPSINKNPNWPVEELKRLKGFVEKKQITEFDLIATKLKTKRSAFQCFQKYQTTLNEKVNVSKK